MSSRSFRFDPPHFEAPPGLRWVLLAAFGTNGLTDLQPAPVGLFPLAEALGLASRIACRQNALDLVAVLGAEPVARLRRALAAAVAQEMRLGEALGAATEVASRAGIPFAVLKGAALLGCGVAAAGSRPTSDVDLLVPERQVEELHRQLLKAGFRAGGAAGYEHQAPLLLHGAGGALELHRFITGGRLAAGRSARFEDLAAAGLLETRAVQSLVRSSALPTALVPCREVLVAHALVHTLAQHGLSAVTPGFLMVGDLADLGFLDETGRAILVRVAPWLDQDLTDAECGTALALVEHCVRGENPMDPGAPQLVVQLARHFVACATLPDYGQSLKSRWLERPFSDRPPALARALLIVGALVPPRKSDGEGCRERLGAYFLRLCLRPFDLAWRWAGARAARRELERAHKEHGSASGPRPPA